MGDKTKIEWADAKAKTPAAGRRGALNPNWKGGRTIASNGYVLLRVGVDHHLADVRGYAYEHRVVAEHKVGRRLRKGEIVHHLNGDKTDNRQDNLVITKSIRHHRSQHRTRADLRLFGAPNRDIKCGCGCGAVFRKYDSSNRPRRFVSGHNMMVAK
jgi:hypothetical protein